MYSGLELFYDIHQNDFKNNIQIPVTENLFSNVYGFVIKLMENGKNVRHPNF